MNMKTRASQIVAEWMDNTGHYVNEWKRELWVVDKLYQEDRLTAENLQAAVCLFDVAVAQILIERIYR